MCFAKGAGPEHRLDAVAWARHVVLRSVPANCCSLLDGDGTQPATDLALTSAGGQRRLGCRWDRLRRRRLASSQIRRRPGEAAARPPVLASLLHDRRAQHRKRSRTDLIARGWRSRPAGGAGKRL